MLSFLHQLRSVRQNIITFAGLKKFKELISNNIGLLLENLHCNSFNELLEKI